MTLPEEVKCHDDEYQQSFVLCRLKVVSVMNTLPTCFRRNTE